MLFHTLLVIHIVSGFSALLLGAMAAVSRKGGKYHLQSGKWYSYAMYIVGASAIAMTQIKPNTFLFTVGVFTLYLTYGGQRAIFYYRLKEAYKSRWIDYAPMVIGLVVAIAMVTLPVIDMIQRGVANISVMMVFGFILLIFTSRDLMEVIKRPVYAEGNKNWLIRHIGLISGAYIATITAFLVTNVHLQPGWLVWLAPTAVGSFLIARTSRSWKKKLKINV